MEGGVTDALLKRVTALQSKQNDSDEKIKIIIIKLENKKNKNHQNEPHYFTLGRICCNASVNVIYVMFKTFHITCACVLSE